MGWNHFPHSLEFRFPLVAAAYIGCGRGTLTKRALKYEVYGFGKSAV